MKVAINGNIKSENEASIPAVSDGLFYGAGCFDTLKSYRNRFLHLNRHIERLNRGIAYLTGRDSDFFDERLLRSELTELLVANALDDGEARVRIQVSLAGRDGYSQHDTHPPNLNTMITARDMTVQSFDPVYLTSVATTVVPSDSRPSHLKLSNMLHYRQAAIEASGKGGDDALMCTTNGYVAETSIANIFWKKGKTVYTPSIACDILPGITRSIIIHLVETLGLTIEEGHYLPNELKEADSAWICNSIRELVWIRTIDEHDYSQDSDFKHELRKQFELYKAKHIQ